MAGTPEARPAERVNSVVQDLATGNPHTPMISTSFHGDPTLGPQLGNGLRRALLGWTHKKDTPEGLLLGRLWCWLEAELKGDSRYVFSHRNVFDAQLNRSPFPVGTGRGPNAAGGFIIDCGVANFGMVRMFHPWWCPYNRVPQDMNSSDKRMCRHRYNQLIRRHENQARNRSENENRANTGQRRRRQNPSVDDSEDDDELLYLQRRRARGSGRNRGRGRPRGIGGRPRNLGGRWGPNGRAREPDAGVNVARKHVNDGFGSLNRPVVLDDENEDDNRMDVDYDNRPQGRREERIERHRNRVETAAGIGEELQREESVRDDRVEDGQNNNDGRNGGADVRDIENAGGYAEVGPAEEDVVEDRAEAENAGEGDLPADLAVIVESLGGSTTGNGGSQTQVQLTQNDDGEDSFFVA